MLQSGNRAICYGKVKMNCLVRWRIDSDPQGPTYLLANPSKNTADRVQVLD